MVNSAQTRLKKNLPPKAARDSQVKIAAKAKIIKHLVIIQFLLKTYIKSASLFLKSK